MEIPSSAFRAEPMNIGSWTRPLGPHGGGVIRTGDGEIAFEPVDPYVGEIRDFVEAIGDDRSPEVDGSMGARNVDLLVRAIS